MENKDRQMKKEELFDACRANDLIKIQDILSSDRTLLNETEKKYYGLTILMMSAGLGHNKIIEYLLSLPDININQTTRYGCTALYYASYEGHADIVSLLLQRPQINVNIQDIYGRTVLHRASYMGKADFVKLLLQHPQININIKDKGGYTALHLAVLRNRIACIELLSNHPDIDMNIKNKGGITAYELKYKKLLSLLPSLEMTRWNRSKIMLVGQGRAGKTALANNLMGRLFEEDTASTIGANQMDVKMYYGRVNKNKNKNKKGRLQEYERPEKEFEAHLVDLNQEIKQKAKEKDGQGATDEQTPVKSTPAKIINNNRSELLSRVDFKAMETLSSKAPQSEPSEELSCYKISLYDFGGQSIFNVLHPFFMSRYGVYLLVFDMELFLSEDAAKRASCHKELKFWLNSIAMHTYDMGSQKTAPVALIGTRKDKIGRREDHEAISVELEEKYRGSEVWGSLIRYEEKGRDEGNFEKIGNEKKGKASRDLCFFPYNNKEVENNDVADALLYSIEKSIEEADYMKREIPLRWIKIFDEMKAKNQSSLDYKEVEEYFTFDLTEQQKHSEITEMLRFLNDMGMLMWIEEEGLKDIIILDPIEYLVKPATMIICKHIATKDDPYETKHAIEGIHDECEKEYGEDWMRMLEYGMVSGRLARGILRKYYVKKERELRKSGRGKGVTKETQLEAMIEKITLLMMKYGLAVPSHHMTNLAVPNEGNTLTAAYAKIGASEETYFFPSLLSPEPSLFVKEKNNYLLSKLVQRLHGRFKILEGPFNKSMSFSLFFYLPSTRKTNELRGKEKSDLEKDLLFGGSYDVYSEKEVKQYGYLPNGLFERLVGPCVQKMVMSFSADENVLYSLMAQNKLIIAFQEKILLTYHHHRVRMMNRLEENRIEVEIEMHDDDGQMKEEEKEKERELIARVYEEMIEMIERLLRECYSSLQVKTLLPLRPSNSFPSTVCECFVSLSLIKSLLMISDPSADREVHHLISNDGSCELSLQAKQIKKDMHFLVWNNRWNYQLPQSNPSITFPLPAGKRTHVFLSHDWGVDGNNHLRVKQINEALKSRGLITWLDDDRGREGESGITSEIPRTIANAIEETACMIVFVTENYRKKVNGSNSGDYCLREFNYGFERFKAEGMIPVVLESSMKEKSKWDGLLGFNLGQMLYRDFSSVFSSSSSGSRSQDNFDRLIDGLSGVVSSFIYKERPPKLLIGQQRESKDTDDFEPEPQIEVGQKRESKDANNDL